MRKLTNIDFSLSLLQTKQNKTYQHHVKQRDYLAPFRGNFEKIFVLFETFCENMCKAGANARQLAKKFVFSKILIIFAKLGRSM